MVRIYENTFIAISAASLGGCNEGFLDPSLSPRAPRRFYVHVDDNRMGSVLVHTMDCTLELADESSKMPINDRPWTSDWVLAAQSKVAKGRSSY
jgi:hypothetical protein